VSDLITGGRGRGRNNPADGEQNGGGRGNDREVGVGHETRDPVAPDADTVAPDEIGVGVPDREPIPADEIGTGVEDLEPIETAPVEEAPPAFDPGALVGTISDLISQFAGGGAGGDVGGGGYVEEPAAAEEAPPVEEAPQTMDIELVEVRLMEAGSVERKIGPRLRLVCRNNGSVEAPKFHASVLVDIGRELTETAHLVTVESVGIQPGKSQSVDVQLPVEVLKMTTEKDPWARPFETLGAFIDSDDSLDESDEDNNVLLLARTAIKAVNRVALK
jgi:hypothetical protein